MRVPVIDVIGAGLAGCEAAWQIVRRGLAVRLVDMKPLKRTDAHKSNSFAELVCSNSLRSDRLSNAVGVLKAEMELLDSIIMRCARATSVPAGGALAVDRVRFSKMVTETLQAHPRITIEHREVMTLNDWKNREQRVIVAPGPLCTGELAQSIAETAGAGLLSFYDAVAPIVSAESINMDCAFWGSRYERGSDYINCPLTKEEYAAFYQVLVDAETAPVHDFEENRVFEACMPIESMARRGFDTMRFGPLKPRGLTDPRTGREPYAVVQLRKEDRAGRTFNIVGFQTRLRFGEQVRLLKSIPALAEADIVRYGVMHRNTFLKSPGVLDASFRLIQRPWIRFAGQITGVEGYVESAASGLAAGISAACEAQDCPVPEFTTDTALGALCAHVAAAQSTNYQPTNINFSMIDPLGIHIRNKETRNMRIAERALGRITEIRDIYAL